MDLTKNVGAPKLTVSSVEQRDTLFRAGRPTPLVDASGQPLRSLYIGTGWTTQTQKIKIGGIKIGSRKKRADYDAVLHIVNEVAGRLGVAGTSNGDDGNRDLYNGAFIHSADDTSGATRGDDYDNEWVRVNFAKIPSDIIGFVAMFDAADDAPFSSLSRAHCKVQDEDTGREIYTVRPQISQVGTNTMAMMAVVREKKVFDGGVEGYSSTNWVARLIPEPITTEGNDGLLTASVRMIERISQ